MRREGAAALLREARERSGLTQSEIARRAGMAHSVLSAYENGRRDPGARALRRILRAAGFDLTIQPAEVQLPDAERAGRVLAAALGLADALPKRPRGDLLYPRIPSS
jgi:uncharacterized protein